MKKRNRIQLVISLGEGDEGKCLREFLDRAAERAGKPITIWARERLIVEAVLLLVEKGPI